MLSLDIIEKSMLLVFRSDKVNLWHFFTAWLTLFIPTKDELTNANTEGLGSMHATLLMIMCCFSLPGHLYVRRLRNNAQIRRKFDVESLHCR